MKTPLTYAEASEVHQRTKELHAFMVLHKEDTATANAIRASVPAGLYQHWKSGNNSQKFYLVHGAGIEQDVLAPFVYYTALYRPHHGILTSRHLLDDSRGFLAPISRPIYEGPRFMLVRELSRRDIVTLLEHVEELAESTNQIDLVSAVERILQKD